MVDWRQCGGEGGVKGRSRLLGLAFIDFFHFYFPIQQPHGSRCLKHCHTTSSLPPSFPPSLSIILPPRSKRERRRIQALRQREIDAGLHGWRAAWADWTALHVPPRWQVLLYNQTTARVAMHTHFPMAGPVLRRLEEIGEWGQWRTLVALGLLYHHGGVLVPVRKGGAAGGLPPPTRSMDCVWRDGDGSGGGRGDGLMMVLGDGEASEEEQEKGGSEVKDQQDVAGKRQVRKQHELLNAELPAWLSAFASSPFNGNDSLSLSSSVFSSSTSFTSLSALSSSPSSPAFAPHFPGVLAAPRHDPTLEAVVEQLFFSTEALDGLREARALPKRQWLPQRLRRHHGKGGQEG